MKRSLFFIVTWLTFSDLQAIEVATVTPVEVKNILNNTRKVMNGIPVHARRPYMLPARSPRLMAYSHWLCSGAIISEEYVITSAACIQNVDHFYVVSGTHKFSPDDDKYNNKCIKNGGKRAIWKCIPKNYIFDGKENDNIKWMNNDIAVVRIEDGFDFTRKIKGCDFIPKPITYNNQTQKLETPGNIVRITGWGSSERYNDWIETRRNPYSGDLLEAQVEIISKTRCKLRWGTQYHNIIENYMICSKDVGLDLSDICHEKYVDCKDINYNEENEDANNRRAIPTNLVPHTARHDLDEPGFRRTYSGNGGFCENDHGGPMVYGEGAASIVIGIISACLVKERTNKCYGPFLYTSVFKNRQFISCAVFKDVRDKGKCRRQFRSGVTHEEVTIDWTNHPDGPPKPPLPKGQRSLLADFLRDTETLEQIKDDQIDDHDTNADTTTETIRNQTIGNMTTTERIHNNYTTV